MDGGGLVHPAPAANSAAAPLPDVASEPPPPIRVPTPDEKRIVPGSEFPIVFEDEGLLVIDKPAGTAVHGGQPAERSLH